MITSNYFGMLSKLFNAKQIATFAPLKIFYSQCYK